MIKPISVPALADFKKRGEKIACLTAYDAGFTRAVDEAGVEVILVGDSLGMVVQGHDSTVPVTLDDVIYHAAAVNRARCRALLMADLPFMTCVTPEQAALNAARLLREAGVQMVKLEGGQHRLASVRLLVDEGVPVCGHLGLLPQSVNRIGGYKVQGRDPATAERLLADAIALEAAGCSALVLECIPASLAAQISARVQIPTIGIGAGPACDGQVLVLHDLLGLNPRLPRFGQDFLRDAGSIQAAIAAYVAAVKSGAFPAVQQSY